MKSRVRRVFVGGTALLAIAVAGLWVERRPLATAAIDQALAARGIGGRYTVREIGFRTQRLEHVRLGDPRHPNLTANWLEVTLVPSWSGVTVTRLRASGVRIAGRFDGQALHFGQLDRLFKNTGQPFRLPDVSVDLRDVRLAVDSEWGTVVVDLEGAGQLNDGFRGRAFVASSGLGRKNCRVAGLSARLDLAVVDRAPRIAGPIVAATSACGGAAATNTRVRLMTTSNAAFSRWAGSAVVAVPELNHARANIQAISGKASFASDAAGLRLAWQAQAPTGQFGDIAGNGVTVAGTITAEKHTWHGQGRLAIGRASAVEAATAVRRQLTKANGTPIGPIALALGDALVRAGREFAVAARLNYQDGMLRIADASAASPTGARATLSGDVALAATPTPARLRFTADGGGLPAVAGDVLRDAGGTVTGQMVARPYRVAGARLVLAPLVYARTPRGAAQLTTSFTLDGLVAGGRVEHLRAPLFIRSDNTGTIRIGEGCMPVSFERLAVAGTVFAPAELRLCPLAGSTLAVIGRSGIDGGFRLGRTTLRGRSGTMPLTLSAAQAWLALGKGFGVQALVVRIGPPERLTQLDVARLEGTASAAPAGRFTKLAGAIGGVPLLVDSSGGHWSYGAGVLRVAGGIQVRDATAAPRFEALVAPDAELRLRAGVVTAATTLQEPVSHKTVTRVLLTHDLTTGAGEARLAVRDLTFGKSLQPEALTRLTLGVVANVQGSLSGDGVVRWSRDRVSSSGRFATSGLDFAAAFGPVTGASGTIEFDDLLALSTPPGQRLHLTVVNPGVEVKDGTIAYRLFPGQKIAIERGRWPFAGGELLLEPAMLDFGQPVVRNLPFHLVGLDAAKFIEQLKLQDLAATGTFDGVLPIAFDASGGRIVGGHIIARPGGGRLAYVGDVSNQQTNAYSKLAFDALKSIRYDQLAIDLDGALDGEIVSQVRFTGVNQSPVAPTGLLKAFTGLPFKFNITVRAPFRGLVDTARGLQDPSAFLDAPVQPSSSVTKP